MLSVSTTKKHPLPISSLEVMNRLRHGKLSLGPVSLTLEANHVLLTENRRVNGVVQAMWGNRSHDYIFEYKTRNTPQSLEAAIGAIKTASEETGMPPLIIVPFLSEESMQMLERAGVSGIDLCGNGVLSAEQFSVWRSGNANRYPDAQPIRNIYRGNSSLLARCFLLRPEFSSLSELRAYAVSRTVDVMFSEQAQPQLTKGTASKVVKALEDALIVRKSGRTLRSH